MRKIILIIIMTLVFGEFRAQDCNYEGPLDHFYLETLEGEKKPRFYCVSLFAISKFRCSELKTEGCLDSHIEVNTNNENRNFLQTATFKMGSRSLTAIETYSVVLYFKQNEKSVTIPVLVGLFKDPYKNNRFFYELSDKPEHQAHNKNFRFGVFDDNDINPLTRIYSKDGLIEVIYHKYGEYAIFEKVDYFNPLDSSKKPYKTDNYNYEEVLIETIDFNQQTITYYPYSTDSDEEGFPVYGNFKPYTREYVSEEAHGSYNVYYPNGDLRLSFKELTNGQNIYKAYNLDKSIASEKVEIHKDEYRETEYSKNGDLIRESFEDAKGRSINYAKKLVKLDEFEALIIGNISFDYEYEYFEDNVKEIYKVIKYDDPDVQNEKIEFYYPKGSLFGYYHVTNNEIFGEYKLFYPNGVLCNEGIYSDENKYLHKRMKVYDNNGKRLKYLD